MRMSDTREALTDKPSKKEKDEEFMNYEEKMYAAKEEDLPSRDVPADQNRKYNPTQKYVQLMYSDPVKFFVQKCEDEPSEDDVDSMIDKERAAPDLNLHGPNKMIEIVFGNGNRYTGRLSEQKMEGQGIYHWRNGSQYKGAFEDNKIQGKGSLECQDYVRYDGDFQDGYQHGKGTLVDKNYNLLYIGEWQKGHKHGKGYCRYEENDSYDGDWDMDKREGVGNRLYANGSRYVGDWKNDVRHGTGTMIWPNGDFYQGEWNQGEMHGCGKYTWNGFFNKRFCWPQENCYIGQWDKGTRDGKGQLMLNSIGGAAYCGGWKENKKHGYGKIIGNNGDVTEGDPLFENNILLPTATKKNLPEDEDKNSTKEINDNDPHALITKPKKLSEARITSVLKPEQCPSLRYYIDRLRQEEVTSSSSWFSLISGKCKKCEDVFCRCLRQPNNKPPRIQNLPSGSLSEELKIKAMSSSVTSKLHLDQKDSNLSKDFAETKDFESIKLEEEERWAYKCISMHMPRIRKVYDVYSKIYCNEPPNCRLSMSRFSLWQLWRDCGIHKKSLSLVQIDKYLADNTSTLMEDPHCPFEKIQIWQLIHAFLEVSWHLYTKMGDIDEGGYLGTLANGLNKFLVNDVYPNFGKSTGILCGPERDLLPIETVYQLYKSIGKPHTARDFLKVVCSIRDHSLDAFRKLGAKEFIQIIGIVCPSLKDSETDIIVNMEYALTFLEFLEIFIEASRRLLRMNKMQTEENQKRSEAAETVPIVSSTKEEKTSNSANRLSGGSKSTKSRKKVLKKH